MACEVEDDGTGQTTISDISDRVIDMLFKELQMFADKTIKANYKINSKKVTQEMIDEAQGHIDTLAYLLKTRKKHALCEAFNTELLELFHVIPRRMQDVSAWLVSDTLKGDALREKCEELLNKEQSTLDVMAGQVVVNSKADDAADATTDVKRDILDVLGLEVIIAEPKEVQKIKQLLGPNATQFKNAYKVVNRTTQEVFDKTLASADNKKTELFWHGSRNENWLNILSTGLLIRPSGAVHTGSMFGDGIYFADKAQKSIGYSSLRGSYFARGSENKAYLALFSVHVGKQKEILHHTRSCYSLSKNVMESEGYDSVFAQGGADLRNNEYIVYDGSQCTVSYLVEIG